MGVALVVRFDVRDEAAAARFDELTAVVVAAVAAHEPGTLVYATHTVGDEPLARVFYEVYADDAAFAAHEEAAHVVAFHAAKESLLVGEPRVEFLVPVAQASSDKLLGPTKRPPGAAWLVRGGSRRENLRYGRTSAHWVGWSVGTDDWWPWTCGAGRQARTPVLHDRSRPVNEAGGHRLRLEQRGRCSPRQQSGIAGGRPPPVGAGGALLADGLQRARQRGRQSR